MSQLKKAFSITLENHPFRALDNKAVAFSKDADEDAVLLFLNRLKCFDEGLLNSAN